MFTFEKGKLYYLFDSANLFSSIQDTEKQYKNWYKNKNRRIYNATLGRSVIVFLQLEKSNIIDYTVHGIAKIIHKGKVRYAMTDDISDLNNE